MQDNIKEFLTKKNITTLLLLGIVILALPLILKLLENRQIIKIKATVVPQDVIQFVEGDCIKERNGKLVATCSNIAIKFISPFTNAPTSSPSPTPSSSPLTVLAYKDEDGDGYTVGAAQQVALVNGQLPAGWVATSQGTDCYDKNADAKPGQTLYFSAKRGTAALGNDSANNTWNSFDYNCSSGTIEYSPAGPTTACGPDGTSGALCVLGTCGGRYSACGYDSGGYIICKGDQGDQLCH